MTNTIDQFMTRAPYCVTPNDSLARSRKLMALHSIRHLPVVDGDDIVGILLGRELEALVAIPGLKPESIPVFRAMRPTVSVSPNMPLDEAVDLMVENEVDCLVVRNKSGGIDGVFTTVDARNAVWTRSHGTQT